MLEEKQKASNDYRKERINSHTYTYILKKKEYILKGILKNKLTNK
jgi:hypothetical protein